MVRRQLVHNLMGPNLRNRAKLIDYANRSLCFTDVPRLFLDDHSLWRSLFAGGTLAAATCHDCTRTIALQRLGTLLSCNDSVAAKVVNAKQLLQAVAIADLSLIKEHGLVRLN